MQTLSILPHQLSPEPFRNAATCIGTGRLGLALQEEYVRQLRRVQELCHFTYIRGHGLFCDDIGIYQRIHTEHGEETRYCFTYLDRIMDTFASLGLKPFLELGFMPKALASGTQTVFYWQGNVTPPSDDAQWAALVEATLRHLAARYGEEEVSTWPVEVWNEPNLNVFWENADQEQYLHLYEVTCRAVRRALPQAKVGGPAVCGGNTCLPWIDAFLTFCEERDLPLDFVTRHIYMADTPVHRGRYEYHRMCTAKASMKELEDTRDVMKRHPRFSDLPIHVTEFNTSYNPFCPMHDTVQNAAIMSSFLSLAGDWADSCSYWTFGDVFEEQGIPFTPFHGGFGLMANGCIPKPTLWAFSFFASLSGQCVYRDDHLLLLRTKEGYEGVLWQICPDTPEDLEVVLTLPMEGDCALISELVDGKHGNPLSLWLDLGQQPNPSRQEIRLLQASARPYITSCHLTSEQGQVTFRLSAQDNTVLAFRLRSVQPMRDDGYDETYYR